MGKFPAASHQRNSPRQNPAAFDVIIADDVKLGFAFGGVRVEFTHLPFHPAAGRSLLIVKHDFDRFTRARLTPQHGVILAEPLCLFVHADRAV